MHDTALDRFVALNFCAGTKSGARDLEHTVPRTPPP
jgi:hypothetical protein